MRPDILVQDPHGHHVLVVEVKARRGVDAAWASSLRRNLSAHGRSFSADFFMIVTTDRAFLWRDRGLPDAMSFRLPDSEAHTNDLLGEHLDYGASIDGRGLELLVSAWLTSIIQTTDPGVLPDATRRFVVEPGLFAALRGTVVAFETA